MADTDPGAAPGRRRRASEPKKLKFPTAFTVLAAVLLLVWIASFFVPAGAYKIDPEDGRARARHLPRAARRARTRRATSCASRRAFDQRLKQLWIAAPNGLYGVENDRGFVSADETGRSCTARR